MNTNTTITSVTLITRLGRTDKVLVYSGKELLVPEFELKEGLGLPYCRFHFPNVPLKWVHLG
jgi:hypothetical protein